MARLGDHLNEAAILLDLDAVDMEQAISLLVERLCDAHGLGDQRDTLLTSAIAREREVSTCFGEGIAVPHGTLPPGFEPVAALGLCPRGLPFPTPDGKPVNCIVLLGMPEDRRDFHVELLGAIASSLGMQETLRCALSACSDPTEVLRLLTGS